MMPRFLLSILLCLLALPAAAADRYWVGGSANWDGSAGSKWSSTSGGAGGASVPSLSDRVFLDAASGASTITISGARTAASIDCTGFTGTLKGTGSGAGLTVAGSITLVSGMSFNPTNFSLTVYGAGTFTTANKSFQTLNITPLTGTVTLVGNINSANSSTGITVSGGFNANGYNVTGGFIRAAGVNSTITMGSGTWKITGNSSGTVSAFTSSGLTVNPGTSLFWISSTGRFSPGSHAFYDLLMDYTGGSPPTLVTSGTFNDVTVDGGVPVKFTAGTTTTINGTLTVSGNSALSSTSAGTQWNISMPGSATVAIAGACSIQDSAASGGASFDAQTCSNLGNNTGWTFASVSASASKMFQVFP